MGDLKGGIELGEWMGSCWGRDGRKLKRRCSCDAVKRERFTYSAGRYRPDGLDRHL
jgi:hypothetical protein